MYNSLKSFMKRFPYFIDKNEGSNFYKSSNVINNNFKDFYNDLFIVHNAHRLKKNILFWRESELIGDDFVDGMIQDTYYVYAYYPHIKSVKLYENDYLIDSKEYQESDEQNEYSYSWNYISRTLDNGKIYEMTRIKYRIKITTYDEYIIEKGFPENDVEVGDIYDHDKSLDEFGALYNIPRKRYAYTNTTNPEKTEPPFNNKKTEDDYHYLNRILYYIEKMGDTPLPVLEVWKLYGIPIDKIVFVNRSHDLCKMFVEEKHPEARWTPKEWEHKDPIHCPKQEKSFFFVTLNNYTPIYGNKIYFTFNFFDMYGAKLENVYTIDAYLNGDLIAEGLDPTERYAFDTKTTQEYSMDFKFIANPTDEKHMQQESEIFHVIIKNCQNADFYVDAVNGNDITGNGSEQYPFKTIQKALTQVEGSKNTIALKTGTFHIENDLVITKSTNIIGCPSAIIESDTKVFFKILNGMTLSLSNITLKYMNNELYSDSNLFTNHNINENPVFIKMQMLNDISGVLLVLYDADGNIIEDKMSWQLNDHITIEGVLLNRYGGDSPNKDKTIYFYLVE